MHLDCCRAEASRRLPRSPRLHAANRQNCPALRQTPQRQPGTCDEFLRLKIGPVSVYKLTPLQDPRWQSFVDRHPRGSMFHATYWLEALHRTYGYAPVVYTTTPPGKELLNGIVFCRIRSWLSGSRLVSLPFSDHCEPLADAEEMAELMDWLKVSRHRKRWKYIEVRPLSPHSVGRTCNLAKSESFSLQLLDLRPSLDTLFRNFHKSCVQRKIHRAERENLTYE